MNAVAAKDRVRSGGVVIEAAPTVLHAILQPEVSLAIWDRAPPFAVPACALEGFAAITITAGSDHVAAQLRDLLDADSPWQAGLAAEVGMLAARFADIMGADLLDVRIERVSGNACWKIHADYVTARLITTLTGRGTEWFDHADAPAPCGQLATGAVGLFKGRSWAPDTAILHRSPPIAGTGEQRLLVVIDPVRAHPPS